MTFKGYNHVFESRKAHLIISKIVGRPSYVFAHCQKSRDAQVTLKRAKKLGHHLWLVPRPF